MEFGSITGHCPGGGIYIAHAVEQQPFCVRFANLHVIKKKKEKKKRNARSITCAAAAEIVSVNVIMIYIKGQMSD